MNQMLTINTTKFKRIAYSFVIAFVFWFFIKSEDTYTVNLDIPLVARNLQEQKTYKEEVPESIFVTLKGTGRSFIWLRVFNNFYRDDFKAVIDLSSITDEYNFELDSYYKENPEKIVLPSSLDLQFVEVLNPRNVQIKLQRYMVKKVPIESQILVSTEPGYIALGGKFSPDSISIGGPEEAVNEIDFVFTEKDTLLDLIASVNGNWSILNPNKLVSFDPKKVDAFIDVQPISETIVTGIPVELINKPNDVNVFVNPATVSLTIVGGLKQITNILPEDIDVIIDFDLWNSEKQFYSPTIKLPDYLIEWKDLSPNNLEILVIKEIN
ncbi:CdaR family protein [Candidatus Marinimicrobia bacterium]|nr:CdaR family protein [Candidatus Neomarinimicrobiota bacterium]